MKPIQTRLSLTALSLALLFSCAAPVVQPGQIKTALDSTKVKAVQEKISSDDTLMDALNADPKAFLAKEGITLPADQQVKVLEVGSKLYLVLDDRSLQLLHPELNKAVDPQNESAKQFASIRAKAASDPAFKAELLKNTEQTLIKEGIPEEIAGQFEVVDYQPNVNLLMVASEGAEISRGNSDEFNLDSWKVTLNGKSLSLPLGFEPLAKKLLNDQLKNNYFLFLSDDEQKNVLEKIGSKFGYGVAGSCTATGSLINLDFCVAYFKHYVDNEFKDTQENSPNTIFKAAFETLITQPSNYPKSIITSSFKYRLIAIQKEYDAINKLKREEVKTPSQSLSDQIAMRWQILELHINRMLKTQNYLIPSGDITKMIGILNSYLKEIREDLTKRGVFG